MTAAGAPPNPIQSWKASKAKGQADSRATRLAGRGRSEGADGRDGGGRGEDKEALAAAALGPASVPPAPGRLIKRRRRLTSVGS